jgi:hypothetical protein
MVPIRVDSEWVEVKLLWSNYFLTK